MPCHGVNRMQDKCSRPEIHSKPSRNQRTLQKAPTTCTQWMMRVVTASSSSPTAWHSAGMMLSKCLVTESSASAVILYKLLDAVQRKAVVHSCASLSTDGSTCWTSDLIILRAAGDGRLLNGGGRLAAAILRAASDSSSVSGSGPSLPHGGLWCAQYAEPTSSTRFNASKAMLSTTSVKPSSKTGKSR